MAFKGHCKGVKKMKELIEIIFGIVFSIALLKLYMNTLNRFQSKITRIWVARTVFMIFFIPNVFWGYSWVVWLMFIMGLSNLIVLNPWEMKKIAEKERIEKEKQNRLDSFKNI